MANIERAGRLFVEDRSPQNYYANLLSLAVENGIIQKKQYDEQSLGLMALLEELSFRFMKGRSSSIPAAQAEMIIKSTCYNIGLYLLQFPSDEAALTAVKSIKAKTLYNRALSYVQAKLRTAKHFYRLAYVEKCDTPLMCYNDTLQNGIRLFFKKYSAEFNSFDTPSLIDYPLVISPDSKTGIEYMTAYLKALYVENMFLKLFDKEKIHRLMLSVYGTSYSELLVNLFDCVLKSAICAYILRRNITELDITREDMETVDFILSEKTPSEKREYLAKCAKELTRLLPVKSSSIEVYAVMSAKKCNFLNL